MIAVDHLGFHRPDGTVEWESRKHSQMLITGALQNLHPGHSAELCPFELFMRLAQASFRGWQDALQ